MSVGELIQEADELLTRAAMIPVAAIMVIMVVGRTLFPDFPALYFFGLGVELWARALVPSFLFIGLIAALLWVKQFVS